MLYLYVPVKFLEFATVITRRKNIKNVSAFIFYFLKDVDLTVKA